MKIVYLYHSIAIKGGAERIITEKMNYLSQTGYEIYLITYLQGNHPLSYNLNSNITHIDLNTRFFTLYKFNIIKRIILQHLLEITFKKKLRKEIKKINPAIFICTTYSIDLFEKIIDSIKGIQCKKILESHITLSYLLEENVKSKNRIKNIIQRHKNKKNFKFTKGFDSIIVLTNKERHIWNDKKINVKIIPNFISSNTGIQKQKLKDNRSIICVGRLNKQKGFDLLIEAWNKLALKYNDWHIDIFGDGEEKKYLEKKISNLGLDVSIKIHYLTNEIYNEYINHSFLVLSSRAEGFALVLIEAMSCGTPCVSFNCPCGPDEIITNGVDGLLAKNGDIDDLADKIEWMITHEKERKEMGIKARESAKRYDKDVIMAQWIKLFDEISKG